MKKAFTLIELLVVIAIIGILSAVVFAQFGTARSKARDSKRVADISQIQLAIQLYFDRCNQYPSTINNIDTTSSTCPSGIKLSTFLSQLPVPPSGSTDTYRYYVHATSGINDNYYIVTTLEQAGAAFDSSLTGTLNLTSGWSPTLSSVTLGPTTLYYAVGAK